jgi:hypothetical protein
VTFSSPGDYMIRYAGRNEDVSSELASDTHGKARPATLDDYECHNSGTECGDAWQGDDELRSDYAKVLIRVEATLPSMAPADWRPTVVVLEAAPDGQVLAGPLQLRHDRRGDQCDGAPPVVQSWDERLGIDGQGRAHSFVGMSCAEGRAFLEFEAALEEPVLSSWCGIVSGQLPRVGTLAARCLPIDQNHDADVGCEELPAAVSVPATVLASFRGLSDPQLSAARHRVDVVSPATAGPGVMLCGSSRGTCRSSAPTSSSHRRSP